MRWLQRSWIQRNRSRHHDQSNLLPLGTLRSLRRIAAECVLFGENVDKSGGHSSTTDTIGAMTKIGAGVQANFNFSAIEAFVPALGPT